MVKITYVTKLIRLVYDNPVLWECRHEECKLAEGKPAAWYRIDGAVNCNRGKTFGVCR